MKLGRTAALAACVIALGGCAPDNAGSRADGLSSLEADGRPPEPTTGVQALTHVQQPTGRVTDVLTGSCMEPERLQPDRLLSDEQTVGGEASMACLPSTSPQRFYLATVPPNMIAVVRAMPAPDPAVQLVMRVIDECGADKCLASTMAHADGEPISIELANTTTNTLYYLVGVSSASPQVVGRYAMQFELVGLVHTPAPAPREQDERSLPTSGEDTSGDE